MSTQFDETLKNIGEFGPYQRRIYFLLCLLIIFIGLSDVVNVFLLYKPSHRCSSFNTTANISANLPNGTVSFEENKSACRRNLGPFNTSSGDDKHMTEFCTSWVYDKSVFVESIVTENNLVCESELVPTYVQMVIYAGSFCGSLLQGILADGIGRKKTICVSLVFLFGSGLASAWSPNYYVFTALRFIQGMSSRGVYIPSFVLGVEMVGPSKRQYAGFLLNYFYSGGIVILAGIGYGFRHWKYIQIASSAPLLPCLIYWWIIPESPRWLISRGRTTEANAVLMKIAESNNTESCVPLNEDNAVEERDDSRKTYLFKHLISSRSLFCHSLVIFFNVFVVYHCYFGFALNTENLSGNFHLNFLINGLVEFPANTLALVFSYRIGRKKLYISSMFLGGVMLLGSAVTTILAVKDFRNLTLAMAMLGKSGVTVGYCVIYLWAAEIFPTVFRNSGMGISLACGNIGYIVAPYMAQLATNPADTMSKGIPLIVFGTCSLGAALLTLLLPETNRQNLPEKVYDAEQISNHMEMEINVKET
ncbi:organic cation transporter protein-like [Mizuhopecten yessoensis]|uniref:Organic cation transporter protein n=1 Tax=Mizuhopecten yessoensis TaxID=6573 RepID=A0A210Q8E4_MIZYE|nr:organic cation transporter protein-like [Mizuhopecten yessoensis]OWF44985.1 Organic cation transporter protein [Mizuhopecten yessoensis]